MNPRIFATRLFVAGMTVALLACVAMPAMAQRGGRGGGGGVSAASATRLDLLVAGFTLTKDQEKKVKTILDADYKAAAPIKKQLIDSRAALGMAIQNNKSDAEIEAATKAYAQYATAMTQAETKALAKVVGVLTEEQRKNQAAMAGAIGMMRGIFYGKKWDMAPDVRFY